MIEPKIILGGQHSDARGQITFNNDFDMGNVKRFYTISNTDTSIIRAWQGHKKESKYIRVLNGSFWVACVKIDNWESPSEKLKPSMFELKEAESQILYIPEGYANGIKAIEPNSKLLVFSDFSLEEGLNDNYKFEENKWVNWSKF